MYKIKILITISFLLFSEVIINKPVSANQINLINANWNLKTKQNLEKLLTKNAGKGKKVIFDFDNTTVSRDIGDATFAQLVKDGQINPENFKEISPTFTIDGKEISLTSEVDITEYYEKIQESTSHDQNDKSPAINGYAWVVQIMAGKTPFDITEAAKKAFKNNEASKDRQLSIESKIDVTSGKTSYRVPFYHPETVNLIGNLLLNGYDVYVISASNVWSIRYMITVELTKLLKKEFGKDIAIKPENVFGLSTLIKDKRNGKLYKDYLLVKENVKYAKLEPDELKNYELTTQMVYPLSGYDGKTANIQQFITKTNQRPFLACGDSPGDFSMLEFAENRLWFSRLESFDYQKKLISLVKKSDSSHWFIQPVLYKKMPGLIKNTSQLKLLLKNKEDLNKAIESIALWKSSILNLDFDK